MTAARLPAGAPFATRNLFFPTDRPMSAQATLTPHLAPHGARPPQVDVCARLARAVTALQVQAFPAPPVAGSSGFEPVHFSRVRCSV